MIRAILTIGIAVGCSIVASSAGCAMESAAGGRPFETQGLRVVARQPGPALLELDFRVSPPVEVTAATMLVNGRVLPASYIVPYPSPGDLSAVLFLVDTSGHARERAAEWNLRLIKALMDKGAAHHRFGLAGFARELSVLSPLGSAPVDIMAAARSPRTKGRIAQIYPSVIQAIDVLMAYPASRRALVIFSDGSAEDPDHSLEEALERANAAGVVIYGLGHARTLRQSLGLQSLRLMASATGGAYAESLGKVDLRKSFLADPFRVLDNGGRATFDLSAAGPGPGDGTVVARVVFHTAEGDKVIDILVTSLPHAGMRCYGTPTRPYGAMRCFGPARGPSLDSRPNARPDARRPKRRRNARPDARRPKRRRNARPNARRPRKRRNPRPGAGSNTRRLKHGRNIRPNGEPDARPDARRARNRRNAGPHRGTDARRMKRKR